MAPSPPPTSAASSCTITVHASAPTRTGRPVVAVPTEEQVVLSELGVTEAQIETVLVAAPRAAAPEPTRDQARLTAETTARSEAVVIEVARPTPHTTFSPTAHSTYAAAEASSPPVMACSE